MKRVCTLALLGLALLRTVEGQCSCQWRAYSDDACKTVISKPKCTLPPTGKRLPAAPLQCHAAPLFAIGSGAGGGTGRNMAMYSIIGSSCQTVRVFWDMKKGNQNNCPQNVKARNSLMYLDVKDGQCWKAATGPPFMAGSPTSQMSWKTMCGAQAGQSAMSFKMDCGGKPNRQSQCDGKATAAPEDCDKMPLAKTVTCDTLIMGGDKSKSPKCVKDECFYDLTPCSLCGNQKLDMGELCDGTMFANTSMCPQGGQQGLACTPMCTLNTTGCGAMPSPTCNNKKMDTNEECDPGVTDKTKWTKKCPDGSVDKLTCDAKTCMVDVSSCPQSKTCDNKKMDTNEECDPGVTDKKLWTKQCPDGSVDKLTCNPTSCMVDVSSCPKIAAGGVCGNGQLEAGEECEPGPKGMNLPPQFTKANMCDDGGMLGLVCKADCKVDKSGCKKEVCNVDGTLSNTELCDGDQFNAMVKCFDGTMEGLKCTDQCKPDKSGCSECGNGVVDSGEDCDPMAPAPAPPAMPKMCKDSGLKLNYAKPDDKVACSKKCKYDWSTCKTTTPTTCGKGGLEDFEMCDYDGETPKYIKQMENCKLATGEAKPTGELKCDKATCAIDTSGCKAASPTGMCGNKKTDAGEQCDESDENMKIPACTDLPPTTGKDEDKFKSGTITGCKDCKWDTSKCSKEEPAADDKAESSEEGNNMIMIVAAVVGVLAVVGGGVAFMMMKKKKAAQLAAENAEGAEEEWDAEDPEAEEAGEEFTTEMEEFGEAEEGDTNYDDFGYDETGE